MAGGRYVECPFCRTGGLYVPPGETEGECPICGESFTVDDRGFTELKGTDYGPLGRILLIVALPILLGAALIGCLTAL